MEINQKDVVPGDIVVLSSGDLIPGDVRLLTSKDMFVRWVLVQFVMVFVQVSRTAAIIHIEYYSDDKFWGDPNPVQLSFT
jgi:magnesium-transporting ATPase (P-type)